MNNNSNFPLMCFSDRDYSLLVSLIPRSYSSTLSSHPSFDRCLSNKVQRARFGTCSCDAHCSWDLCRSSYPPSGCLLGTGSIWKSDSIKNAWVAQLLEGNKLNVRYITMK